MKVEILDKTKDQDIIKFLDDLSLESNSVLGYHYPFYRDMLTSLNIGSPFYLALVEGDTIIALLPGFVKESKIGTVYSSMPFFGPNAGILCESGQKEKYAQVLLPYLSNFITENQIISSSIYSSFLENKNKESAIFSNLFPLIVNKFTSYLDLKDYDISNKVLYDVRKAQKKGVEITSTITVEKVSALFDIYHQNCLDYHIPEKPKECVEYLAKAAESSENISFYFAELDQQIIGGLIMIWSKSVASYYLPCSLPQHRTIQPNTLLIAHALDIAKKKQIKIWNWESSPDKESGVYKFKKKWGSIDGEYSIFIKSSKDRSFFAEIGKDGLLANFSNFFVYPFDQL